MKNEKKILTNLTLFSTFYYYFFFFSRNPVHNGDPAPKFAPVLHSSKTNQFQFLDVRNEGIFPGRGPNGNRTLFLDKIVKEVKRLVEIHGDAPIDTPIKQQCDTMQRLLG